MSDSQFAAQVDTELQRVTAKIEQLQSLKSKLEDLKQALPQPAEEAQAPSVEQADPPPADTEHALVPQARRANTSTTKAKSTKARTTKTAPAKKARSSKKAAKAPQARRTRTDRIFELLDEQPRSAAEVTKLLEEKHPDQKGPESTVRTALNSLVGQNRAYLSRQGSAVFYSSTATGGATADAPATASVEAVATEA